MLSERYVVKHRVQLSLGLNPCCSGRCSVSDTIDSILKEARNRLNPCCSGRCSVRAEKQKRQAINLGRLNPCCSGRCSVSLPERSRGDRTVSVLILVVVEDAQ